MDSGLWTAKWWLHCGDPDSKQGLTATTIPRPRARPSNHGSCRSSVIHRQVVNCQSPGNPQDQAPSIQAYTFTTSAKSKCTTPTTNFPSSTPIHPSRRANKSKETQGQFVHNIGPQFGCSGQRSRGGDNHRQWCIHVGRLGINRAPLEHQKIKCTPGPSSLRGDSVFLGHHKFGRHFWRTNNFPSSFGFANKSISSGVGTRFSVHPSMPRSPHKSRTLSTRV